MNEAGDAQMYRGRHLVADAGLVDSVFGCSTALSAIFCWGQMRIRQHWHSSSGKVVEKP